ncbi:MAG: YgjV family protein [Solobacterium sp.]|nr:YgjV family protein [Solobacterium sp.]
MDTKLMIELFGYLGSALVVISMLMTSVVRLRVINTIGSIIFMIYALIIRSYPTALMNLFLVGINIYQLLRLKNTTNNYHMVEVNTNDRYLEFLLSYYESDINTYFPEFKERRNEADVAYMICLDSETVGITMGKHLDETTVELFLDYSTPTYRDCSVGQYLYSQLKEMGIKELVYKGKEAAHIEYVEKVGFEQNESGDYIKKL